MERMNSDELAQAKLRLRDLFERTMASMGIPVKSLIDPDLAIYPQGPDHEHDSIFVTFRRDPRGDVPFTRIDIALAQGREQSISFYSEYDAARNEREMVAAVLEGYFQLRIRTTLGLERE